MCEKATARRPTLMALHSDSHKQSILSKLDQLRKRDVLCDVTLLVEDVPFKAHRALLAASSEYFSLMLTAGDRAAQPTYRLPGVAAKTFAAVLEFIYSAQVSVEEAATQQLLEAARLMELSGLVEVLTALTKHSAGGEGAQIQEVEKPEPTRRKRGRPKKIPPVAAAEPEVAAAPCDTLEEMQPGPVDCDDTEAEPQPEPEDDADYSPRTHRQSKRKIRPPVKFKSYKVDRDTAGSSEPGKKGRKRKYPNTEARCEDCDKVFKNHLFLKIHQRTHTGEKPFRCIFCSKSFTQKHTLLAHQRMHTGEKPFVCTVCSKALSTKHSLQEHMNLHQEKKSFSCEKCGKTFTQKRQLKSHYRVHTGKSLPECAQCHHKFMDTAQLKKHLRTHTGEKPFTCEICGKCFTAKSTLQTHIRIHKGEKPYDCNICNKSFSDPSARRRHVTSHSGKKPFTCSFCSLSFTRMDNLKTHTKSHNKERPEAPEEAAVEEEEEEEAARASAASAPEEARSLLQLQPYSEQEIQLVMTADVDNINFVPAQEQEISIITSEAQPGDAAHPRLTLLAPGGQANVQNVALVSQGGAVEHGAHIQTISMLEQQPEHMHVITLSKEAMEQLQAQHGPPQPLQVAPARPVQQHGQAIHISSQSSQPISISQTSQQISSHHIQGQTFQIQAGTVSYLYTTGLPQQS